MSRSGSRGRGEGGGDEEEEESGGYVQVLLRPLEQGGYPSLLLNWLGLVPGQLTAPQQALVYSLLAVLVAGMVSQLIMADPGYLLHRLFGLLVPLFAVSSAYYWLALYLRKSWSTTSVYILFCACFAGEFIGQCFVAGSGDNTHYITRPLLSFAVLLAVSGASVVSSLETTHSTCVIVMVSATRYLSCTSLIDMPQSLRPFLAYMSGLAGIIAAKYMETVFRPPVSSYMTHDGKIPVIKRRRSSSSAAHSLAAHRIGRRTSLPALIHSRTQSSTASYESAIIGEAHGLITDMLADSSLPPHVVSGLRSVSNLLKPQDSHGQMHKPKVSPLVSLTESGQYGSDSEDLPYTGERPSSLPKRFRRSLPPSLMRRMSTSTWTTTTSATGLPTLEPEVCRTRSSSFRHSRENTPGSSPTNSRSNSPSPSSPTTISLMIPKSRSFSATVGPVPAKRNSRERRSGTQTAPDSNLLSPIKPDKVKGLPRSSEADTTDIKVTTPTGKETYPSLSKRLNITSDYESSDSPGSSDHSDNVASVDESSATGSKCRDKSTSPLRPQKLVDTTDGKPELVKTSDSLLISSSSSPSSSAAAQPAAKPEQAASLPRVAEPPSSKPAQQGSHKDNLSQITAELESRAAEAAVETDDDGEIILPYSLEEIENTEQLHISRLSEWDYSIFDLADKAQDRILSQVAYKIFTEVGLFETFRIPLPQFLSYFHSLELGYREKPYHNRVHATDVLHGVYYLSTQPIPGFPQVNPEGDMFQKHISSSESDSETSEKCVPLRSFTAEDTYGIMGGNLPPLELMALYTAAAMHDYDHPGRTNAFLVTTNSPLAILYNDRSVLESHHAASAWRLFLSNHNYNWLSGLDKAEFKRFRFLVIEAVLATDLKRHFELLAEFNAKVNDEDAPGIDWTSEADRLMVSNMVIKLADINGPCKRKELHVSWTDRITEEFYEQGDEESTLGLPISPYMDRQHPQLAKLQESFINHLVAPLCNAVGGAGLIPGTWVEDDSDEGEGVSTDSDKGDASKDTEEEDTDAESGSTPGHAKKKRSKKIHCWLTKNLKDNHDMWVNVLKQEAAQKERETKKEEQLESITKGEMEPISEEDTPPNSANNLSDDQTNPSPTPDAMGTSQEASGLSPAAASQSLANNTSEVQRTSQTEIPSPCLPRRCPSPLTTPTCTIIQSEPTCSPSSQSEPQVEPANQKDESRIQLTPERCILNKDLASNRSTEV